MRRILPFLLIPLLLLACNTRPHYRPEVTDFFDDHPEIRVFYFYESTLRMLNTFFEGTSVNAFPAVEQARLGLVAGEAPEEIGSDLEALYNQLEQEGAELLFSLRRQGTTSAAYKSAVEEESYLICISDAHSFILLELVGQVSLQDIQNLSTMDFGKVAAVFNLNPDDARDQKSGEKEKEDSAEIENNGNK